MAYLGRTIYTGRQRSRRGMPGRYGVSGASAEREAAVKKRETEARGLYDEIIGMYQPGGAYGKGTEAMLERQKTKSIAQAQQGLVSSGLFGTTMTAGLPKKFEEEVGMPTRSKLEDLRYGALSQALTGKAGFLERIEDMPLDTGLIAQLTKQASSAPVRKPFKSKLGADYSIYGSSL